MDTKSRTRLYFRFERKKTGFGAWPLAILRQYTARGVERLCAHRVKVGVARRAKPTGPSLWIALYGLTQVKLMSTFIFVNRPLRFDPSLVIFCKHSLQSARLSKGYLRAGVLAPNARHLVACATCLPPWEGAMPIAIDQGLRRKKSPSSNLDLLPRCPISRAPSSPVDEGVPGIRSRPLAGQNVPYCGFYVSRGFSVPDAAFCSVYE
jgi:hypothetical protein